jgi:putative hydrolase of the HAD superfamily
LARAQVDASSVVHVGDMLSTDVNGARAAGILPLHLDPYRACRARDHRHVRFLNGIWSHVAPSAR